MNGIPRPFLLLMAASLALNLFFVGVWAGRHWSGRDSDVPGQFLGARAFLRRTGLSDAEPAVQQIIQAQRGSVRKRVRELREARAQVREALKAEPFDPARLDSAFAALEKRSLDMQHDMHLALSQLARAVDSTQRARMAEALWPKPGMHHRGRGF